VYSALDVVARRSEGNVSKTRAIEENELNLARIILQEERLRLIKLLQKEQKNISDLAKETGQDRATVSYHLDILERSGIVNSDYEMLKESHSKGKIGRFYRINQEKLTKTFLTLEKLKEQMKP
jgi:DNA-binding transcriptional ArsR family regulator